MSKESLKSIASHCILSDFSVLCGRVYIWVACVGKWRKCTWVSIAKHEISKAHNAPYFIAQIHKSTGTHTYRMRVSESMQDNIQSHLWRCWWMYRRDEDWYITVERTTLSDTIFSSLFCFWIILHLALWAPVSGTGADIDDDETGYLWFSMILATSLYNYNMQLYTRMLSHLFRRSRLPKQDRAALPLPSPPLWPSRSRLQEPKNPVAGRRSTFTSNNIRSIPQCHPIDCLINVARTKAPFDTIMILPFTIAKLGA